jgi:hypothetical protein
VSLADLVTINVSAQTATPTKPNFGVPLIAVNKVPGAFTTRSRLFSSLKEMTDFGFNVADPAYLCASKMKSQDPSIEKWLVGKRLNKPTQTVKLTVTSAVQNDVYSIKVNGTLYTYTVPGAATTTSVATALAALINANAAVTASAAAAVITVTTDVVGDLVNYQEWTTSNIQFKDDTADPGIAADLAAIAAATSEDWYGLALDSNSHNEVVAAAAWVEANKKIFPATSSDWGCGDAGTTTDVMSVLKAAAYARSGVLWSKGELLSYSGATWMAKQFAGAKPGEDTWAFKTLNGITADILTGAEYSAILAKNGNFYQPTSGINITERGTSAAGEFFDITRFVDWQRAEIQFRVYSALVNNKKLPYSDIGIDALTAIIEGALEAGVDAQGLVAGTIQVLAPKAATIPTSTKATRKLSNVTFKATLAGAIHQLDISGTLTP